MSASVHEGTQDILKLGPNMSSEFNDYLEFYSEVLQGEAVKKVIIVEDDAFSQKILENTIYAYNPDLYCFFAKNEEETLNILEHYKCQLVIADYFLEGNKTGLDVCNDVRELYPDTKCIIVSKIGREQFKELAGRSLMSPPPFIEKPVKINLMQEMLNVIFGGVKNAY